MEERVHQESFPNGYRSPAPAIRTEGLRYSYPDGTAVLRNVEMEVPQGECTLILGANGSGKSTLLLNLAGILRGAGTIEIMGKLLADKTLPQIRRILGLVFQNPEDQLFCPTVHDDVAFGPLNLGMPEEAVREAVNRALGMVGLNGFEDRLSHRLSFGEKKRIAIATVLSMSPEILLLDEPTSGLDPRSGCGLIDILMDLREQGKTILTATHDLHLASEVADRILILGEEGWIVAAGGHDLLKDKEILQDNNLLHVHRHGHERRRHAHPHFHGHQHEHEEERE